MKTMSQRSSHAKIASRVLRCCTVLAFGSTLIAAQSRIIRPQSQPNPKSPAKQRHVATIWSSDSTNGSRVALTSDQSLSNYEAYRRDDRFYVKIPAADLPQAEAVRGRGFANVKAQRSGDSTVVSFRVQQGAAVHVEQYSNRLDVVITLPGARLPATPPSSNINTQANSGIEATKRASALKQNVSPEKGGGLASSSLAGNNPDRGNALIVREAGSARTTTIPTQRTESVPAAPPRQRLARRRQQRRHRTCHLPRLSCRLVTQLTRYRFKHHRPLRVISKTACTIGFYWCNSIQFRWVSEPQFCFS